MPLVVLALLASTPARADDAADAENLFARAKALMNAGKFADACPLLKESYRLDPAQGTLLNLAMCNERTGRIASAWAQFRAVEQQARRAVPPREDRVKTAKKRADALEPMLGRVRVVVPPAARSPGLVVRVDGDEKGEPTWAIGVVVDPGAHVVEVTAPGKKPSSLHVESKAGATVTVEVAALEDVASSRPDAEASEARGDARDGGGGRTTAGVAIGCLGLATAAVGGVFGVLAITNGDDAKCAAPCTAGSAEAARSNDATDRSLAFANVANVTVPVGLVAAGVGAYLLFSAGPAKVSVIPRGSQSAAGLDLVGRW